MCTLAGSTSLLLTILRSQAMDLQSIIACRHQAALQRIAFMLSKLVHPTVSLSDTSIQVLCFPYVLLTHRPRHQVKNSQSFLSKQHKEVSQQMLSFLSQSGYNLVLRLQR